ncbi:MAG: glycosyltransferase family 4 protein [Roseiflexaceae bacterium]|nr:glycosyltransferase family 4 protein [Roseiflexaceae bacterium]
MDSTAQKSILVISYYYAPTENPGTRRVGAFVRYLPQYGYRPVVLTTSGYGALADDEERLIFRAPDILDIGRWLARRARRTQPTAPGERLPPILTPDSGLTRVLEKALIPDIHIGWLPSAVLRGRQVLRAGTFRALFSSSPPPSAHLVALALKQLFGLPWVADFRDGWTFEPPNSATLSSPARLRIERALERAVVLSADQIVTVNQVLADDLRRRYPTASVTVISNGYDSADVATPRPHTKGSRLRVIHTGALARSRSHTSVDGLLAALDALQQKQSPVLADLEVCFIGNLGAAEREALIRNGCRSHISIEGPIPHCETLRRQAEADVLLLVTAPNATSVTTSKLFEYLASGRPILALTGRSAAAALVEEFKAGIVIAPDDVDGICRALEWFHERWRANDLPTRVDPRVQRFDRRNLTGELAKVFDTLI